MKSRLTTLFLAFCVGFSLLTITANASGTVSRGTSEYKALEDFLAQLGWWSGSSSYHAQNAAVNSPVQNGAKNILEAMLSAGSGYCYDDSLYPGEVREEVWDAKDPLGKWDSYWKTNSQKVDWVLRNIFNCSDADITALKSSVLSENPTIYELDGYYYTQIGGVGGGYTVSITDVVPAGGKYLVRYNLKSMYDSASHPCYAVVEQKTMEGKNYWSLHYNTALQDGQNPVKTGGFLDVEENAYYCGPILWAVEKGVTAGTSLTTFSPNATCTKGQILMFLWRAEGQPEPQLSNPFRDISPSDYYYKASIWAAEHGLVSGETFRANEPCTRAMVATYLWKLAGSPSASGGKFSDVPQSAAYAQAVAWAVRQGITSGTGNHQFSPNAICTRGQIVTFLYRYAVEAVPVSSPTNPAAASGWSMVYKDFVLNRQFLNTSFSYDCDSEPWGNDLEYTISLHDLDADGVPELFISNGLSGKIIMRTYVYTYTNDRIEYIGNAPSGFSFYLPGSQFSGVWGSSGSDGVFYNTYYYKDGNQVKSELVSTDDGLGGNAVCKTSNTALFETTDLTKMSRLTKTSIEEIWKIGWDHFITG